MVDYNKQRREAIKMIDGLASKGKFNPEDIAFHIMRDTGFSQKFTVNYINECLERKFFSRTDDGFISSKSGDLK